jgi:signal transduction histidine kinase
MAHIWILYAIVRHRLLDVRIAARRTLLLFVIYLILILALIPTLRLFFYQSQTSITATLLAGAILSLGPFIYAFAVRRASYFHEDTIAGLTHEMKTPLAAIQSALEILNSPNSMPTAVSKDYLQMIRSNAARLQGFVDSLIHVFGNTPKTESLQHQPVDMVHLCLKTAESIRTFADIKGLSLITLLPMEPIMLTADAIKLGQALSNVLFNAVKFSDQGSIVLQLERSDHNIHIRVCDTGVGLTSNEITRVFDRFYQGEIGKQKKGTGIGLTLAKHWMEAHGGKIEIWSGGRGKGTTVTLVLPII